MALKTKAMMACGLAVWLWGAGAPAGAGLHAAEAAAERVAEIDAPPRPIRRTSPVYPFEMRQSGYRGRVLVEFVVDERGAPRDPRVVSSNHPAFEQAAIAGVLEWRFEPAKKAGKPVSARVRQAISFEFEPGWVSVNPFSITRRAHEALPEEYRYDVAPEVDLMVAPVYPRELAVAGVKGFAETRFVVDEKGRATQIQIDEASHPDFGAALAAAVEGWRFEPARKGGKPALAAMSYRHEFGEGKESAPVDARLLKKLRKDGGADIPSLADLDRVPKMLFPAAPVYPAALRRDGVEGVVRVRFIIDRDGAPRFPAALDASHAALGWAAVTAVQRQRYERPMKAGRPVDAWAVLPLNFVLDDAPVSAAAAPAATP